MVKSPSMIALQALESSKSDQDTGLEDGDSMGATEKGESLMKQMAGVAVSSLREPYETQTVQRMSHPFQVVQLPGIVQNQGEGVFRVFESSLGQAAFTKAVQGLNATTAIPCTSCGRHRLFQVCLGLRKVLKFEVDLTNTP